MKPELKKLRQLNIELTKQALRESVTPDILIIQAIKTIEETDHLITNYGKRLREWLSLHNPELCAEEEQAEELAKRVLSGKYVPSKNSYGSPLKKEDKSPLQLVSALIFSLEEHKQELAGYVEQTMKTHYPNIHLLAGPVVGAQLLERAGNLKRLAEFPASTIQTLGAEKALFRHLKTGSRPPKYGILFSHDLVHATPKPKQGKAARLLADKISIAARIDFFKGEFRGEELLNDIKEKLK